MRRLAKSVPWLVVVGVQLLAQRSALEPVLRAELAFARLADQQGIRTAFLTCLTDAALVFTPRMTSSKEQYGREPGDPGHLVWYPEAMGIAAAGDLAWSLGPWTYAVKKGEPVLVNGHFLSIWQKQADGRWKVEADIGVPHAAPRGIIEAFVPGEAPPAAPKRLWKAQEAAATLQQKETALAAAWVGKGGLALLPELAKDARVLRPRSLPLREESEIRTALEAELPGSRWEPARLQVAMSGDLGWVCGESGPDARSQTASFLRIWTRESGTWKVLFDVRLPHPAVPK